jgi:hypothetical protein
VIGAPFVGAEHGLEALGIQVAVIHVMAGVGQGRHDLAMKRGVEAVFERMRVHDEIPHGLYLSKHPHLRTRKADRE